MFELKLSDFGELPVKLVLNGKQKIWHYTGNDLQECIKFAKIVREAGETFFDVLTGKPFGTHTEMMDTEKCLLLLALCQIHQYKKNPKDKIPRTIPKFDG